VNGWAYGIGSVVSVIAVFFVLWYLECRYNQHCSIVVFLKSKMNWKQILRWLLLSLLSVAVLYISNWRGNNLICCACNMAVYLWLLPIAYIDYKEQIIPNKLVVIGLAYWIILFILDVFVAGSDWVRVLQFSGIGLLFGAGVFLVGKLFVKDGIGMGDVKLYGILGLLYGYVALYSMLFITLIVLFVVGIVLLIRKKGNRKMVLPMAPYTLLGFLCAVVLGI
jgi:Flp pilus assembly protein protease CpaA